MNIEPGDRVAIMLTKDGKGCSATGMVVDIQDDVATVVVRRTLHVPVDLVRKIRSAHGDCQ